MDGGYIVCNRAQVQSASSYCIGSSTAYVIKFSKFGKVEWQNCYSGYDYPGSIVQTSYSGYLFIETTSSGTHGSWDGVIIKISKVGQEEWFKYFGGSNVDILNGCAATKDDGFIICGQSVSVDGDLTGVHIGASETYDAWVLKIDSLGNIQWQKCYGDFWAEEGFYVIKQLEDSSYVICGYAGSSHVAYALKLDKMGNYQWGIWQNTTGELTDCDMSADKQFFFAGSNSVIKCSSAGEIVWQKFFDDKSIFSIHFTKDNLLTVCGLTSSNEDIINGLHFTYWEYGWSESDIYLSKIDTSGNTLSTKCFGGTYYDYPRYFTEGSDGGYAILGITSSVDGDVDEVLKANGGQFQDYWVLKVGNYNRIIGSAFYDYNNNGIQDNGEPLFKNVKVVSEKFGGYNGMFIRNGTFNYTVDTGKINTYLLLNRPYYQITPAIYNTSYQDYNHIDTINFAVYPVPGIKDLSVSLSSWRRPIPRGNNYYTLVCTNNGTELMKQVKMGVKLDSRIEAISFDSANFSRHNDTLFWSVANLEPGNTYSISIQTKNAVPPFLNVGDTISNYIEVFPFDGDSTIYDNNDTVKQIVVGSYDPNNKLENSGGFISTNEISNEKYLTYTINFQNTGTAAATNIRVRDTLDSKLDWNTFEVVESSHNYQLNITNSKNIEWVFHNINLLDSVHNESQSHGYIIYRIKPKKSVHSGDTIYNSAGVYFDYNLPVKTNVEQTIVKDNALPLHLLSFTAQHNGKINLLKWSTANEINTDHFDVQRSSNSRNFAIIGSVKSFNNGKSKNDYVFTDEQPLKAVNYYRLKMIDKDGKFTYSAIRSINNTNSFEVTLYPNPVKNDLTLNFNSEKTMNIQIEIISAEGKMILSEKIQIVSGTSKQTINTISLNSCKYFVRCTSADGQMNLKFVK